MNCSCNSAYTGIGCQYEFDACAKGACKNGATCIDNGGMNFKNKIAICNNIAIKLKWYWLLQ